MVCGEAHDVTHIAVQTVAGASSDAKLRHPCRTNIPVHAHTCDAYARSYFRPSIGSTIDHFASA